MKYFKKTFIRYVAMGLAMAFVSFLLSKGVFAIWLLIKNVIF